jgi:hypothetical protein
MRKTSKRYLAIILALVMMLSFAPMALAAEYDAPEEVEEVALVEEVPVEEAPAEEAAIETFEAALDDVAEIVLFAEEEEEDPIEAFVFRLYDIVLERDPDEASFKEWIRQLEAGVTTGAALAHAFFFSKEYNDRDRNEWEFVADLYMALLGRWPNWDEHLAWAEILLSGMPREDVFQGFANSAEFGKLCAEAGITQGVYTPPAGGSIKVFITSLYWSAFGRPPSQACLDSWTAMILAGTTGASVAHGIFFSPEAVNSISENRDFVERLYWGILGRDADDFGRDHFVTELNRGVSREQVFAGLVNSSEFARLCAQYGIIPGSFSPPSAAAQAPLLDQNGVKVTQTAAYAHEDGTQLFFLIENNSNHTIYIEVDSVRVNGVRIWGGGFGATLLPGTASRANSWISASTLELFEIESIDTVEMTFVVREYFNEDILFFVPNVSFKLAPRATWAGWVMPTVPAGGEIDKVLMDRNDVVVTYAGSELVKTEFDDGWWEWDEEKQEEVWIPWIVIDEDLYLNLEIENNSDREIAIYIPRFALNGRMIGLDEWLGLSPGDSIEVSIYIHPNDTSWNGINTITEAQFIFVVYRLVDNEWGYQAIEWFGTPGAKFRP